MKKTGIARVSALNRTGKDKEEGQSVPQSRPSLGQINPDSQQTQNRDRLRRPCCRGVKRAKKKGERNPRKPERKKKKSLRNTPVKDQA